MIRINAPDLLAKLAAMRKARRDQLAARGVPSITPKPNFTPGVQSTSQPAQILPWENVRISAKVERVQRSNPTIESPDGSVEAANEHS
jgi:hypothetical protein